MRGKRLSRKALPLECGLIVIEDDPTDVQEHHHAGLWSLHRFATGYRAPHACRHACMWPRASATMTQHCSTLCSLAPITSRFKGPA